MKSFLQNLFKQELGERISAIAPITGFGSINQVFAVKGTGKNYIVRLNQDADRLGEFEKEYACIHGAIQSGVPTPAVLSYGTADDYRFMIQEKVEGINATLLPPDEKVLAWEAMGRFCIQYHQLPETEIPTLAENDFHGSWEGKRRYNIDQLVETDPLLQSFSEREHEQMRHILQNLDQPAPMGLVHGDLSLRNVIAQENSFYLIDWGAAERDIVPHAEIGKVIQQGETSELEMKAFIKGLGYSTVTYQEIKPTVQALNLLDRLDKFRWATDQNGVALGPYVEKLRAAFELSVISYL